MSFKMFTTVLLSAALAWVAPRPIQAQEAEPAVTPAFPDVQQRLGALEQQIADQKRQIEAMQAEHAAAEAASVVDTSESEHPKLSIYGFLDTGIQYLKSDAGPLHDFIQTPLTFVSGYTNLYFDARPDPAWRSLVEVRLTLYPNGTVSGLNMTSTRVMDTTSPSGHSYVSWNSIIIDRAWLQWTMNDHLALQAGYLLTPYGIWNVDHGTPTLISLVLPSMQVEEAIPQHQIGVQALGNFIRSNWELDYHAYITNGRTTGIVDTKWQKALGGRLVLRRSGELRLAVGTSGFYGSTRDQDLSLSVQNNPGTGEPEAWFIKTDTVAYHEWSVGADVSLDWRGFRIRTETLTRHIMYQDGLHAPVSLGEPGTYDPNHYSHYAYIITAYRFATHYEPYLFFDYNDSNPQASMQKAGTNFSGGLNIYFTAAAMLKMQYADQRFWNSDGSNAGHNMKLFLARVILVF